MEARRPRCYPQSCCVVPGNALKSRQGLILDMGGLPPPNNMDNMDNMDVNARDKKGNWVRPVSGVHKLVIKHLSFAQKVHLRRESGKQAVCLALSFRDMQHRLQHKFVEQFVVIQFSKNANHMVDLPVVVGRFLKTYASRRRILPRTYLNRGQKKDATAHPFIAVRYADPSVDVQPVHRQLVSCFGKHQLCNVA